jgi:hypothetical protein
MALFRSPVSHRLTRASMSSISRSMAYGGVSPLSPRPRRSLRVHGKVWGHEVDEFGLA